MEEIIKRKLEELSSEEKHFEKVIKILKSNEKHEKGKKLDDTKYEMTCATVNIRICQSIINELKDCLKEYNEIKK